MSFHRLVAYVSATALVGLFGFARQADASNFSKLEARKPVAAATPKTSPTAKLREKIRNANIDGCGGEAASVAPVVDRVAW